ILSAPAIWGPSTNLQIVVGVIDLFRSASYQLCRRHENLPTIKFNEAPRGLSLETWTVAVLKGTEGAFPPSRRVPVLSGLLQGFHTRGRNRLSGTLQDELVKSVNLSLRNDPRRTAVADSGLVVAICQVFDLLDMRARQLVDHDLLLPILIQAIFSSEDGVHHGYFLGTIDADLVEGLGQKFDWSIRSNSFLQLQSTASGPLVADLGRLAQLAAFSVGHAADLSTLKMLLQDLLSVSRSLCTQWRQNKLSEVDVSEETMFLTDKSIKVSLPLLWRVLRSSMFAIVVILASYTGRLLGEKLIKKDDASSSAIQMLKILRNLYFISSRLGIDSLSQYSFVYLAAIDILSQYPMCAEVLLNEIQPTNAGAMPQHPLDRCQDIYFLNAAEHFTPILDTKVACNLLATAASPYLGTNGDQRSTEAFEAAHSVMLAIFAAPHNIDVTASRIEEYIQLVFEGFPRSLSPRQIRLAIKQLVRLTSPPSLIAAQRPWLASTILEIVRCRIYGASSHLLANDSTDRGSNAQALSEQAVLAFALIDSLPSLQLDGLHDWLTVVAQSCQLIQESSLRHACNYRLWEVLSNGDMDVDRAAFCVNWWNTEGGREMVLCGEENANGRGE
ncbi:MAG: hypothetical protein Q9224_000246, partial [Gallowayella concinna]